jgi:hypothetical protein
MHTRRLDWTIARYLAISSALAWACGAPADGDDDPEPSAAARGAGSGSAAVDARGPFATMGASSGSSEAQPAARGPSTDSEGSPSGPDRSSAGAGAAAPPGPAASGSNDPAAAGAGGAASAAGAASGAGGSAGTGGGAAEPSVRFEPDILPLLRADCGSCHASGSLPRFASSDADTAFSVAVAKSQRMLSLIAGGDMPPACSGRAPGGRGCVSADDFSLIQAWVGAGTPR